MAEPLDTVMIEGDMVVLFRTPADLDRAERMLLGQPRIEQLND